MTAPTILVVDDDAGIRSVVQDSLALHGFTVLEARDTRTMDRVLASSAIDLIILDVLMPGGARPCGGCAGEPAQAQAARH
jgi:two-component system OmpR family response regulator